MGLILPTGSTAEIEEVSGNITIPEIAHDTEEDEYVVCIGYHCSWFPISNRILSSRLTSSQNQRRNNLSKILFDQSSFLSCERNSRSLLVH